MAQQKRLAVVVGAGASSEFSLPVGSKLTEQIAALLNLNFFRTNHTGDQSIWYAVREYCQQAGEDLNKFQDAAERIRAAMPLTPSIDQFIHTQRGNRPIELCGKLAIARAILQAEARSTLYASRDHEPMPPSYERTTTTWLNAFFRVLVDGCSKDELDERLAAVSLVVFNYDRCVEHFLYHAISDFYRLSSTRVAELMKRIQIYHPYGSVGALPWQSDDDPVAFGQEPSHGKLLALTSRIKTFTEGTDISSPELSKIRAALGFAPRILFLGFAYHPLNLQFLTPRVHDERTEAPRLFGTALGLSDSDCEEVTRELAISFSCQAGDVALRNTLTAAQIFSEYTRPLSFRSATAV